MFINIQLFRFSCSIINKYFRTFFCWKSHPRCPWPWSRRRRRPGRIEKNYHEWSFHKKYYLENLKNNLKLSFSTNLSLSLTLSLFSSFLSFFFFFYYNCYFQFVLDCTFQFPLLFFYIIFRCIRLFFTPWVLWHLRVSFWLHVTLSIYFYALIYFVYLYVFWYLWWRLIDMHQVITICGVLYAAIIYSSTERFEVVWGEVHE